MSESGSVMTRGWLGVSGPEPAGSASAAEERIAVVSISRPCKSPPHGEGDHTMCDLAHTDCRRVSCRDRADSSAPHAARRDCIYRLLARLSRGVVAELQQLSSKSTCYVAVV